MEFAYELDVSEDSESDENFAPFLGAEPAESSGLVLDQGGCFKFKSSIPKGMGHDEAAVDDDLSSMSGSS